MIDTTPLPSSIPIYALNSPSSWTKDRGYGEGGGTKSRTAHSLTWIQAGNSLMVETLHLFPLDLPARSTQMESGLGERERTDGQTHKQRADSTPHSQSQSHYREVGSRDWRGNNTFWMPSAFNKVNILNMLASRVQSFGCHKNCNSLEISWLVKVILDQAYIYPLSERGQKDIYITTIVHTKCTLYAVSVMSNSLETYALVWGVVVHMLLEHGPNSREEDNSELRVRAQRWPGAASRDESRLGHFPSQFIWLMCAAE